MPLIEGYISNPLDILTEKQMNQNWSTHKVQKNYKKKITIWIWIWLHIYFDKVTKQNVWLAFLNTLRPRQNPNHRTTITNYENPQVGLLSYILCNQDKNQKLQNQITKYCKTMCIIAFLLDITCHTIWLKHFPISYKNLTIGLKPLTSTCLRTALICR